MLVVVLATLKIKASSTSDDSHYNQVNFSQSSQGVYYKSE